MAIHQMNESSPSNAPILLINTTGNNSCACIIDEDRRDCLVLPHDQRRAESLLPTIDDLLTAQYIKLHELAGIIVVTGPGSFTGTKVGITVANTLAWATKLPIAGITADELDIHHQQLIERTRKSSSHIIIPTLPPPSITVKR